MSRARDLEQRAAHWVLRQEEAGWSTADQHDLDRWLAESNSHKAAFWRLEHGWREADRIGSLGQAPGPLCPAHGVSRLGSRLRLPLRSCWFSRPSHFEPRFTR